MKKYKWKQKKKQKDLEQFNKQLEEQENIFDTFNNLQNVLKKGVLEVEKDFGQEFLKVKRDLEKKRLRNGKHDNLRRSKQCHSE